jgi:hypothetical protein
MPVRASESDYLQAAEKFASHIVEPSHGFKLGLWGVSVSLPYRDVRRETFCGPRAENMTKISKREIVVFPRKVSHLSHETLVRKTRDRRQLSHFSRPLVQ